MSVLKVTTADGGSFDVPFNPASDVLSVQRNVTDATTGKVTATQYAYADVVAAVLQDDPAAEAVAAGVPIETAAPVEEPQDEPDEATEAEAAPVDPTADDGDPAPDTVTDEKAK